MSFGLVISRALSKASEDWRRVLIVRYVGTSQALYSSANGKTGSKELSKVSVMMNVDTENNYYHQKYSNTLFLPRTTFPVRVEGKKRLARDEEIFKKSDFDRHYQWQRENRSPGNNRKYLMRTSAVYCIFSGSADFVLHDGPPYANGEPHMGHAVNKILKDMTNRYQVSRGRRVHYVPGWDCHGLPIELKAVKGDGARLGPGKLREIAGKFAESALEKQKSQFRSWGVMADWSQPYLTMSSQYVKTQLEMFYKLYQNGHIFRLVQTW